jgi:predicted ATP-dependent protease
MRSIYPHIHTYICTLMQVLAAHRGGLKHVILPHRNKRDLAELPATVTAALQFTFVETLLEAFHVLFNDAAAAAAADTRMPVIAAQAATADINSSSNSSGDAVSSTALCSAAQRSSVLYGPVLTSLL